MKNKHIMDYEKLLKKYMNHVKDSEGIDYTDRLNERYSSEVVFDAEEYKILKEISKSINESK